MRSKGIIVSMLLAVTSSATATTLKSTALSDIGRLSSAVVQGEVIGKKTLLDSKGVPWTIFTLAVDAMFAGEFAGKDLSFRIIGGPMSENTGYYLVGAPRFAVGDSIVLFYNEKDECQVTGTEFGVFWRRDNESGESRLVDFRDQAVASFSEQGPVFSAESVPRAEAFGARSEPIFSSSEATSGAAVLNAPPAAEADLAIDELEAFAARYVTQPAAIKSTVDLAGTPDRSPVAFSKTEAEVTRPRGDGK